MKTSTSHKLTVIIILFLLKLFSFSGSAQTGPGGVGKINGTSTLELWFDGKDINGNGTSTSNGATVTTWTDKSGNGVNVTQNIANVATYTTSGGVIFNNTGYLQGSDASLPLGGAARTLFVTAASPNTGAEDVVFFYGTSASNNSYSMEKLADNSIRNGFYSNDLDIASGWLPSNQLKIFNTRYSSNFQEVFSNGTSIGTKSTTPNTVSGGASGLNIGGWVSFGLQSNATMNEVILYSESLIAPEKAIVENYLSEKYGITLTSTDYYSGHSGSYTQGVQGIGTSDGTTANTHTLSAASGGLQLQTVNSTFNSANEYVFTGYAVTTNTTTTSDLGSLPQIQSRWSRTWYLKKTGTTDIVMSFDFSTSGIGGSPSYTNYALLYSASDSPYSFADWTTSKSITPTISGTIVTFTITNADLTNGYYTLGTSYSGVIASSNPASTAGNLCASSTKNPIYSFNITSYGGTANITGLNFTTTGTYAAADLTKFQLWYNTSNSLSTATQIGSDLTPAAAGLQTFAAFSQALTAEATTYFWITANASASPTNGNTISVSALTTSNYTLSKNYKAGSTSAGSTHTLSSSSAGLVEAAGQDMITTNAVLTLTGAGVGGSATTGAWSIISSSPAGTHTLSSTSQTASPDAVTFTPQGSYTGTVTLRLTTNGCVATDDRTVIIVANSSTTYTTSGTWTAPCGVTSATVQCWGGGGGGGSNNGGAGGGGAYSSSTLTVTPGSTYTFNVGAGGSGGGGACSGTSPCAAGGLGGDSWFSLNGSTPISTTTGVLAKGGSGSNCSQNSTSYSTVAGGQSSAGYGTTNKYNGGSGGAACASCGVDGTSSGGGGGAAAGSSGNGANGSNGAANSGGSGGVGTGGGGNGGAGGTPNHCGSNGVIPGGGGGGGGYNTSPAYGGYGATGQVIVTYPVVTDPSANAGSAITVCQGVATQIGTGASVANATGATWSTVAGTGTLTNPTNTVTATYTASAADAAAGSVKLFLTASTSCENVAASKTIIVIPSPTASAGGSTTICTNGTATVSGAGATNGTIAWTENGAGSITSGSTGLTPVYTPAAGDAGNTVTLTMTVTGTNACSSQTATATYSVLVNALPTATAGGSKMICLNSTATVSGASQTNGTIAWTENGAGSITSGSTGLTPVYTSAAGDAGSTVTLTMTVTSSLSGNGCSSQTATASYSVTVTPSGNSWIGSTNTDWFTAGNWCVSLPSCSTDAIVPAGTINSPAINASGAVCSNLTIYSGATLTMATTNTLGVCGNWVNNGTFTAGSSNIYFNGTANQTISGSNSTTFYNLTLSNTGASGSDVVTLSKPVTVSNILTLTDGILATDATNLLTLTNSSAGATTGGNSSGPSFVKGPIRWNGLNGAGPFIFPTGVGTSTWARVAVSGVTSATDFTASYTNTAYTNVSSAYLSTSVTPTLTTVSHVEYWDVARTSGTGNAAVTLYWENSSTSYINSCTSNGDLKVAHYNTGTNKWENANTSGTVVVSGSCSGSSAGTVKSDVMTTFSPFSFGSGSSGVNPLPIELLSFDAVFNGTTTDISWQTASEINNNYFTVERSTDGINFTTLSTLPSKAVNGNSTSVLSYTLNDPNTVPGIYYYRLKQTDFDFKYSYSNVAAVTVTQNVDFTFDLAPNPNDGNSTAGFITSPYSGMVTLKIYNIAGSRLHIEDIQVKEGENNPFKIQFKDRLDSGTYIVIAILNGDLTKKKLMMVAR